MTEAALPRVFFDSNEGTHAQGYFLYLPLSLRELAAIEDLKEGLEVMLYMPEELEMRALLRRMTPAECAENHVAIGTWLAEPIVGTARHQAKGASASGVRSRSS